MGGMNNETSVNLTRAKYKSKEYHAKQNDKLYKEFLESGSQYTCTFLEWKQSRKKKPESKKQKPLTKQQLKERGYNTKSLNESVRWK